MNFLLVSFRTGVVGNSQIRVKEISKQTHVSVEKLRKTDAAKSRVILILHLIDWERGPKFFSQSKV